MDYVITDKITPEEYMEMRKLVGWATFPIEEAKEGLSHTAYVCCFRKEGTVIAMARMIWDYGYTVFISDVIVRPEYQKQGLGTELMKNVMKHIKTSLKPGYKVMVCLMSAKGREGFYQRFGFIDRPNEHFGCGMHQWLEG